MTDKLNPDGVAPTNDTPNLAGDPGLDAGSDASGLLPSVSRRQIALLIALTVVVAIVAWWVRDRARSGGSGGSDTTDADAAGDIADMTEEELVGEVEITDEDGDGRSEIKVPANPSDELEKDAAVLDALKTSGKFKGASD